MDGFARLSVSVRDWGLWRVGAIVVIVGLAVTSFMFWNRYDDLANPKTLPHGPARLSPDAHVNAGIYDYFQAVNDCLVAVDMHAAELDADLDPSFAGVLASCEGARERREDLDRLLAGGSRDRTGGEEWVGDDELNVPYEVPDVNVEPGDVVIVPGVAQIIVTEENAGPVDAVLEAFGVPAEMVTEVLVERDGEIFGP